jgi:two-component system nitrogen regulation sensor histidine kinase GlnL
MMGKPTAALRQAPRRRAVDAGALLNALTPAIVVVDGNGHIVYLNSAAEQFFKGSASHLEGHALDSLLPGDSPLFALVDQVRNEETPVSEYAVPLEAPKIGKHFVNIQANPLPELPDCIVLALQERSIADKIDRQLTHRGAARSVTAMAAMLAHEVKNPLSGIRGAAQLLEESLPDEDRPLTSLIRDEVDRICALVDRMEIFSESDALHREAVNIHQVLDRVRQLAQSGFGRHVRFVADFDPSLPSVLGNHDQLVQVFLNLVKNATEAVRDEGGEIVLATAYQHGVRLAIPGREDRVHLPLMVSVQDNGDGIPDDIQSHLFDPFVTSKPNGSGLGLALVAKIIGDHGGAIEFESQPRRTIFRVLLPTAADVEGS